MFPFHLASNPFTLIEQMLVRAVLEQILNGAPTVLGPVARPNAIPAADKPVARPDEAGPDLAKRLEDAEQQVVAANHKADVFIQLAEDNRNQVDQLRATVASQDGQLYDLRQAVEAAEWKAREWVEQCIALQAQVDDLKAELNRMPIPVVKDDADDLQRRTDDAIRENAKAIAQLRRGQAELRNGQRRAKNDRPSDGDDDDNRRGQLAPLNPKTPKPDGGWQDQAVAPADDAHRDVWVEWQTVGEPGD